MPTSPDQMQLQWDADGKPFMIDVFGHKSFMSPMSVAAWGIPGGSGGPTGDPRARAWAEAHGVKIPTTTDANGQTQVGQITNNAAPRSGIFTNRGEWNPSTGQFDKSVNWNNIMAMAVGGLLTAGVADIIANGGAATVPAGQALSSAVPASATETAALPATIAPTTAASTVPSVASVVPDFTSGVVGTLPTTVAPTVAQIAATTAPIAGAATTALTQPTQPTTPDTTSPTLPNGEPNPNYVFGQGTDASMAGPNPPGSTGGLDTGTGGTASTLKKVSNLLGAGGQGVAQVAHDQAAGRLSAAEIALKAQQAANQTAQTNTLGQSAFETELMNRAKEEQLQRTDALKNIYRQSYATNRTPGPFNQAGLTKYSPDYLAALGNLTQQGGSTLSKAPIYGMDTQPKLAPLPMQKPFDPNEFMNKYGTPGTLESAANWISPTVSTLGKVYDIWNRANAS